MLELHGVCFTAPLAPAVFQHFAQQVSLERQVRLPRFYHWQDAHRCLLAELLARHVLGRVLGIRREELVFSATAHGKLFLASHPHVHFNLSHSGQWVVCAVADSVVGVDVEEKKEAFPELITACFSPDEQALLYALPPPARRTLFYELWTAKESYAKAVGLGLGLDFREYSMAPYHKEKPLMWAKGDRDAEARFWIDEMDILHSVALCLKKTGYESIKPLFYTCKLAEFIDQLMI